MPLPFIPIIEKGPDLIRTPGTIPDSKPNNNTTNASYVPPQSGSNQGPTPPTPGQSTTVKTNFTPYFIPPIDVVETWNTKRLLPNILLSQYTPFSVLFLIDDNSSSFVPRTEQGLNDSIVFGGPTDTIMNLEQEYFANPSNYQTLQDSGNIINSTKYIASTIKDGTFKLGAVRGIKAKIYGYCGDDIVNLIPLNLKFSQLTHPEGKGIFEMTNAKLNINGQNGLNGYYTGTLSLMCTDITQIFSFRSVISQVFQYFSRYLLICGWQGPTIDQLDLGAIGQSMNAQDVIISGANSLSMTLLDGSQYNFNLPSPMVRTDGTLNFKRENDYYIFDTDDIDHGNRIITPCFGQPTNMSIDYPKFKIDLRISSAEQGFQFHKPLSLMMGGVNGSALRTSITEKLNRDITPIAFFNIASFFPIDGKYDAEREQAIAKAFYNSITSRKGASELLKGLSTETIEVTDVAKTNEELRKEQASTVQPESMRTNADPSANNTPQLNLNTLSIKSTASLKGITPTTIDTLNNIDSKLKAAGFKKGEVIITSGTDSHQGFDSSHNSGNAIDINVRPINFSRLQQVYDTLRNEFKVSLEPKDTENANGTTSNGDHIHIETGSTGISPNRITNEFFSTDDTTNKINSLLKNQESDGRNIPNIGKDSSAFGLYQVTEGTFNTYKNQLAPGTTWEQFKASTSIQEQFVFDLTKKRLTKYLNQGKSVEDAIKATMIAHKGGEGFGDDPSRWNEPMKDGISGNEFYASALKKSGVTRPLDVAANPASPNPTSTAIFTPQTTPFPADIVRDTQIDRLSLTTGKDADGQLVKYPAAYRLGDVITTCLNVLDDLLNDSINNGPGSVNGIKAILSKAKGEEFELNLNGTKRKVKDITQEDVFDSNGNQLGSFTLAIQEAKIQLASNDMYSPQNLLAKNCFNRVNEVLGFAIVSQDGKDIDGVNFIKILNHFKDISGGKKIGEVNNNLTKAPFLLGDISQKVFTWDNKFFQSFGGSQIAPISVADLPISVDTLSRVLQGLVFSKSGEQLINQILNAVSLDFGFSLRCYHKSVGTFDQELLKKEVQLDVDNPRSHASLYQGPTNKNTKITIIIDDEFLTEKNIIESLNQQLASTQNKIVQQTNKLANQWSAIQGPQVSTESSRIKDFIDIQNTIINNEYSSAKLNGAFMLDIISTFNLTKSISFSMMDGSQFSMATQYAVQQAYQNFKANDMFTPLNVPSNRRDIVENFSSLHNKITAELIGKYKLMPGKTDFNIRYLDLISEMFDTIVEDTKRNNTTIGNEEIDQIKLSFNKNSVNNEERRKFIAQLVSSYLYNRPLGTKFAYYLGRCQATIHGTIGLGLFQGVYLRGVIEQNNGIYLINNVTHNFDFMGSGGFTTEIDTIQIQSASQQEEQRVLTSFYNTEAKK